MKFAVKKCYCLVDDNENIISSWDTIEKRGDYIVCSKNYKKGGLSLCCYENDKETPIFEIDYVHTYKLTEYGIIVARREYTSDNSYLVKYGVLDYSGRTIIPLDYNKIKSLENEMYFYVQKYENGSIGFFSYLGREILPIKYDELVEHSSCLSFERNNKVGLYFFENDYLIMPRYEFIEAFYEKMCVKLNGKWGMLSSRGKYLLSPIFDNIYDISEGDQFLANIGNEYIIYNSNMEWIHIGTYEDVKVITSKPFGYTYCIIKLYDKEDTYLYVPTLHTFVKGNSIRLLKKGTFQYQANDDLQWYDIPEDMYGNVWKITDLYSYE